MNMFIKIIVSFVYHFIIIKTINYLFNVPIPHVKFILLISTLSLSFLLDYYLFSIAKYVFYMICFLMIYHKKALLTLLSYELSNLLIIGCISALITLPECLIIILSIIIYLLLIVLLYDQIYQRKVSNHYTYDVMISFQQSIYEFKGFLDTGNNSESMYPIIYIQEHLIPYKEYQEVYIYTMNGSQPIKTIKPDSFWIKINEKFVQKEVIIGLSNNLLQYQVLLNINLFKGE